VALLLDAAGDLAGYGNRLGRLGRVVRRRLVVQHDGGAGVGEQEGVGRAGGVLEAQLEAALQGAGAGPQVAAEGEAAVGGGRVDRRHRLLQHAAVDGGGRVGDAAGQVAAPDGDLRRLAGLDDARVDGVDPGGEADAEAVEVLRGAL